MPAMISSVEVSLAGGTSGNDGQPLVVALLEEGEELLADLVGGHRHVAMQSRSGDRPPPDDHVAAQQARGLARARRRRRARAARARRRPRPCSAATRQGSGARAVAQLDARRPRPPARCRRAPRSATDVRGERLARAGRRRGSRRSRWRARRAARGAATPRPLRWPTVKWCAPRWRREHGAVAVDDLARALVEPAVAGQERGLAGAGQEAQVLRLGLGGDRQPGLGGERAHLRLGQLAEREAQPRERRRRHARRACRSGPWPGRRRRAAARRSVTRA